MVPLFYFSTMISTIHSSVTRRLVLDRHAPILRRRLVRDRRDALLLRRRPVLDRRDEPFFRRRLVIDRRVPSDESYDLTQHPPSTLLSKYPIRHYIPSSFQRIRRGIG